MNSLETLQMFLHVFVNLNQQGDLNYRFSYFHKNLKFSLIIGAGGFFNFLLIRKVKKVRWYTQDCVIAHW